MRNRLSLIALCAMVALAGCQRTGFWPGPRQPAPLSPTQLSLPPVYDIRSGQFLPPAGDVFPDAPATQEPGGQELQAVAVNAPEVTRASPELTRASPELTRASMVGRWTITAGGDNCDVFLALTAWSGGYRAASRGCTGQVALISSWDVAGNQVVLSDSHGNRVVEFQRSDDQRFEGTTATGHLASLDR